jgi:ATP-dependent Clp protease ATP-binding subunit ClpC
MFMHFNDAARLVLRIADQEARRLHHDSVGTEHLLLALVQLHGCVAARVLAKGGIRLYRVRLEVEISVPPGSAATSAERRRLNHSSRKSIAYALAAADRLGHVRVGTGHLLLGLLEEGEGVAFWALCRLGIIRLGRNLSRVAEHVITEMHTGLI